MKYLIPFILGCLTALAIKATESDNKVVKKMTEIQGTTPHRIHWKVHTYVHDDELCGCNIIQEYWEISE